MPRRRNTSPKPQQTDQQHPHTPDGRYFVVRGRLWRLANPDLPAARKAALVKQLMDARRGLRGRVAAEARAELRRAVDEAKRALGERGPVWWFDGAPDYNRRMVQNTPYAAWFARLNSGARGDGPRPVKSRRAHSEKE